MVEQLLLMVESLRKATEILGTPTEEEISLLIDEVRTPQFVSQFL